MKFLKYLLIIIVALVAIYFIAAIASPKTLEITTEKVVEAPLPKVFKVVNDYNHYMQWNEWSKMESDEISSVQGIGTEVGDVYSWEGDTIGTGRLEKVSVEENQSIHNHMVFLAPWQSEGEDYWNFEETETGTKVVWTTEFEPPFYMRPVMGFMMKPMLEKGLENIAEYVANIPDPHHSEFVKESIEPMKYLGTRRTIKVSEIGNTLGDLYANLAAFCGEKGVQMAGMPMAFYHTWDGETTEMEAAFPILEEIKGEGEISYNETEEMMAITAIHYGSYESSAMTHEDMDKYIQSNGLVMNGPVCEIYLNDPTEVEEYEIQTKIIYPVSEAPDAE